MEYEVIGKTCGCSGKEVNMILRTITEIMELVIWKLGRI